MDCKPNILLDLDQTCISAEGTEDDFDFKKYKTKAKLFEFHDMDGYYIIFERPGLQTFLDYLFENFNVSVWTAASKDYALFIINKIILQDKPGRHLDWIFCSYHCDISKKFKNGSKDLTMLWDADAYKLSGYNSTNTVIIDDYDEVYKTQPGNCIIAKPFEFTDDNSENDKYLFHLQKGLKKMKQKICSNQTSEPAKDVNQYLKKIK